MGTIAGELQEGLFEAGGPAGQLSRRGVGQEPSLADHDQPAGHQGHFADQVAGDQDCPAFGGQ
jgi:hypothetical protein